MVWEQECAAVVMLTREEEAGKVRKRAGLGLVTNPLHFFRVTVTRVEPEQRPSNAVSLSAGIRVQ